MIVNVTLTIIYILYMIVNVSLTIIYHITICYIISSWALLGTANGIPRSRARLAGVSLLRLSWFPFKVGHTRSRNAA